MKPGDLVTFTSARQVPCRTGPPERIGIVTDISATEGFSGQIRLCYVLWSGETRSKVVLTTSIKKINP